MSILYLHIPSTAVIILILQSNGYDCKNGISCSDYPTLEIL